MNAMERIQKMLDDHHDMTMNPFMQHDEADALATLLALADAAVELHWAEYEYTTFNLGTEELRKAYERRLAARQSSDAAITAALTEPTP